MSRVHKQTHAFDLTVDEGSGTAEPPSRDKKKLKSNNKKDAPQKAGRGRKKTPV